MYNFRDDTIQWQMSKSANTPIHLCTSSYHLEIIFLILDLQKVGHGHGVQFSQ